MSNLSAKILYISLASSPLIYLLLGSLNLMNNWTTFYNVWRILQYITLFICLSGFLAIKNNSKVTLKVNKSILTVLIGMLILSASSIYNANSVKLALLDAMQMIVICGYGYVLYIVYHRLPTRIVDNIIAFTVLWPIYFIVSLIIGWYLYFTNGLPPNAWYSWFENIRYFDDTLLPLIFLLWLRPGFLKKRITIVVILASFFLLMLLLHGARANWLGIIVGLSLAGIAYKGGYKKLLVPVSSIFISIMMYKCLTLLENKSVETEIVRTTSSGRVSLWLETLSKWWENPILGIGGGNFVRLDREVNHILGHPHNIVLQLLVEWGIVGLIIVLIGVYIFYIIFRMRYKLHPIMFAGSMALAIDMLLSGIHVYASSQMMLITFFVYVAYKIFEEKNEISTYSKYSVNQINLNKKKSILKSRVIQVNPIYFSLVAIIVILFIIGPSVMNHGIETDGTGGLFGPRFWFNGYNYYLNKL